MLINDIVCFGDSHSICFNHIMKTHYFPASSARGLSNNNSLSNTNNAIRSILRQNKYDKYIFFFGKVDNDFILNHMYNKYDNFDIEGYIQKTVVGYIEYIKSLNIENVYICELPFGHLQDDDLLNLLNSEFNHNATAMHLNEKYEKLPKYEKILSLDERNRYLLEFNSILKTLCSENGFTILEINKYFMIDSNGKITIPSNYIHNIKDHHLDNSISELFMKGII